LPRRILEAGDTVEITLGPLDSRHDPRERSVTSSATRKHVSAGSEHVSGGFLDAVAREKRFVAFARHFERPSSATAPGCASAEENAPRSALSGLCA
jgi:hypothetical protein